MNVDVCQSCTIAVFQGCVGVDRQAWGGGGELLDKSFSHSNLRHIDFVSLSTNLMTYKKVNPLLSGFLVV